LIKSLFGDNMKLVVIIPAYNEEKTIADVINQIPYNMEHIDEAEVLVIDDGSVDNTVHISRDAGAKVVSHNKNMGVGVAFSTGIQRALEMGADIIVTIDADGQFNPHDIPTMVEPILNGNADFTTASRFLDPHLVPEMPRIKIFGNHIFTKMINIITNQNFKDTQCGFRAYSKEAAMRLVLFGKFTYTQEVFLDLAKQNLRIVEIPLKVKGQRVGKSRVVSNIFSYGIKALVIIIRSVRDYKPLAFFGIISLLFIFVGTLIGLFILQHWLSTGQVSPYKSLTTAASALIIIGLQMSVLALLADMIGREMKLMRDVLYYAKVEKYNKK